MDKEQISPNHIKIEALQENDIILLEPILREHVRDRDTGEILLDEINNIKNYMKGQKDDNGRLRKYFVAKDVEGNILGCMAYSEPDPDMIEHFQTTPDDSVEILNAFVSTEVYRGGGIGRKLFNVICQEAKSQGKKQLLVHSGPRYKDSWGFYDNMCDESCGFLIEKYGKGGDAKTWKKVI